MVNTVHDTYSKFSTPSTQDLFDKCEELSESLDKWGTKLEQKIQESMETLVYRLPLLGQIASDVQLLNSYIGRIDELYYDFKEYLQPDALFSQPESSVLMDHFISRSGNDLQDVINKMYVLVVPGRVQLKKSLFLLLAQETRVSI